MWSARRSVPLILLALSAAAPVLGGCGYTLQRSAGPLFNREGIHRIYIAPIDNETYKPGVENVVFSALTRKISAQSDVTLTRYQEDADAVIKGTVSQADYSVGAKTTADQLAGADPADRSRNRQTIVGTQYKARLQCRFQLEKRVVRGSAETRKKVWASRFSRSKVYPGNNQLGVLGTTSALINDSEFDRALSDLAESMMGDVYEAMVSVF